MVCPGTLWRFCLVSLATTTWARNLYHPPNFDLQEDIQDVKEGIKKLGEQIERLAEQLLSPNQGQETGHVILPTGTVFGPPGPTRTSTIAQTVTTREKAQTVAQVGTAKPEDQAVTVVPSETSAPEEIETEWITDYVTVAPPAAPTSISEPPVTEESLSVPPAPVPATPNLPFPTNDMGGGEGYKAVGYYTNWSIYGRQYMPQQVPASELTHILYAFANNREDGEIFLTDPWSDKDKHFPPGDTWEEGPDPDIYGNLKQLFLKKKQNRALKVLLSIGGWTYAHEQKSFDAPAASHEGRKRFAHSCLQHVKDFGFDGIDVDWEYPSSHEQGEQLYLLLVEIRQALEHYADELHGKCGHRPNFQLTIAAPAGRQNYQFLPLSKIASVLTFINVMSYDFAGGWDQNSGHTANLYPSDSCPACTPFSTSSWMADYLAAGVPPHKIVLGMPLYGRSFQNTEGIGKPFYGVGGGIGNGYSTWEPGSWDFKGLPRSGATEHYDPETGATWSYDPATRELISYDNVDNAKRKATYIQEKNLGGAMWWELSGDRPSGDGSIITNVVRDLGGHGGGKLDKTNNWLQYPDSRFANLRKGFPGE